MFIVQVLVDCDSVEGWANVRKFQSYNESRRYMKTHEDGELVMRIVNANSSQFK